MILIDDVERLLEFTRVDNIARFSNMVLQALLVLLKRRPPSSCRLMVVVATSLLRQMKRLHLDAAFAAIVQLPGVAAPDGLKTILQYVALREGRTSVLAGCLIDRRPAETRSVCAGVLALQPLRRWNQARRAGRDCAAGDGAFDCREAFSNCVGGGPARMRQRRWRHHCSFLPRGA